MRKDEQHRRIFFRGSKSFVAATVVCFALTTCLAGCIGDEEDYDCRILGKGCYRDGGPILDAGDLSDEHFKNRTFSNNETSWDYNIDTAESPCLNYKIMSHEEASK